MSLVPFEIKSIKLIAEWNYDCDNETCEKCQKSIYQSRNAKIINDDIVLFECGHSMHRSCFKSSIRKSNLCLNQQCNQPLKFTAYANNKISNNTGVRLFKD
jgi:hypothetical protein